MIELDNDDIFVERRDHGKAKFSLIDKIYVESGTREDWDEFHALHYKAQALGIFPRIYRIGINEEPIGCIVFTVPRITLAGRNTLLSNITPNQNGLDTTIMNKYRAKWLNKNTATLSRLVLDMTFRGVGVAYRAQNIAMRMTGLTMLEFQSSMSRVNPFAQKAGIIFSKPKRNAAYSKGIMLFKRWFTSIPTDYVSIFEEFKQLNKAEQAACLEEMRSLYYTYSCMEKSGDNRMHKRGRVDSLTTPQLIKSLQQLVFAFPLYGAYMNPDKGRTFPDRVPISVFDSTPVNKPVKEEDLQKAIERMNHD